MLPLVHFEIPRRIQLVTGLCVHARAVPVQLVPRVQRQFARELPQGSGVALLKRVEMIKVTVERTQALCELVEHQAFQHRAALHVP